MNYKAPRGTHDIWGIQAEKLHILEETCRAVFGACNFAEMRFPTFEDAGLFTRSLGDTSDIVEKEMYIFTDRKDRKLALRPEGTASVVRAYLEGQLTQHLPVGKLFYMGSMFRYERPQAGRYREFYQIGAEYFGDPAPTADAAVVLLSSDILKAMGLKDIQVHLHTLGCPACRPLFRKALKDYFEQNEAERMSELCADCKRRIVHNPLRVLDCKIDSPKFQDLPKMETCLCDDCRKHFCDVQELLSQAGCAFTVDHRLVRGLDYYTRTVFEIRSPHLGSQDALAAGGRYDNLVKELGGSPTPAVGFALGSERVILAADNAGVELGAGRRKTLFIAATGKLMEKEAFRVASALRRRAFERREERAVEGPFAERSLKSQLRLADKLKAEKVVIFGEDEFKRGVALVRDMKTQEQKETALRDIENL